MQSPPGDTSPTDPRIATPSFGASPRAIVAGLAALLFVSGAAGLVYEVAWTRRLLLLLGSTSTTGAVVLAAFLGGLGLGGAAGGRLADRTHRPIALYGLLELFAAAWALLVPVLLTLLASPYVAVAGSAPAGVRLALRALIAALVVVPGAAAIGATYPALVAAAARRGVRVGGAAVLFYGTNTLGAVVGALWAGFSGIFVFGVLGATRVAAAGSAVVGAVALLAGARRPAPAAATHVPLAQPPPPPARLPRGALLAAAASGFVALGLEAAGVRILVFFVQGFTSSFAAMLGVFLGGLALGTLVLGTPLAARANARAAVGALLLAAGVVALVETSLLGSVETWLKGWRREAYAASDALAAQRAVALRGSALLFFAPAFLLGAAYPLCVRWAAGGGVPVGRAAGRVALWNGVGAVVAPLVVLGLGRLGARDDRPGGPLFCWALVAAVAALAGSGCLVAGLGRGVRTIVVGSAAGLAAGFLLPLALSHATPLALVSASHVPTVPPGSPDGPRSVVAVRADDTTTASVVEAATGDRTLYTDDFAAAATARGYSYMRLLGHLPALSVVRPQNAMVIAFGTGTTAGAVAAHPDVERLEIAETSRAVLDLAPEFRGVNADVLSDPRVRVRVEDGRNALLLHAPDLDVLTLEPLLPFTPAALPFYTREFYELARSRLREGGVLCQWLPVHAMPLELYQALVRTFFRVFPDGSIWYFEQSTALLGFVPGPKPDASTTRARAALVERGLRAAGYATPAALVTAFVAPGSRALAAIEAAPAGPLARETVTDEFPFPEAHPSPRAPLATSWLRDTLEWLAGLVTPTGDVEGAPLLTLVPPEAVPVIRQGTIAALRARAEEATADFHLAQGDVAGGEAHMRDALAAYGAAMRDANRDDLALRRRQVRVERWTIVAAARAAFVRSDEAAARGDASGAASAAEDGLAAARRAFEIESTDPVGTGRPEAAAAVAEAYLRTGRCAEAVEVATGARAVWGWDPTIVGLTSAAVARQRGSPIDPASLPPAVARALRAAPPCRDAGTASVTAEIARFRGAWFTGKASQIRLAGDGLMQRVTSATTGPHVARGEVAAALEAMGSPPNPAADVEREAVLRLLVPSRPRFAELVLSGDADRAPEAIEAAGHYGIEAMALAAEAKRGLAAPDPTRRLLWVAALHDDGSPWALARLLDTLDDADPAVRGQAAQKLLYRVPEARRAELAFDPAAPEPARAAARDRLRAFFAPK